MYDRTTTRRVFYSLQGLARVSFGDIHYRLRNKKADQVQHSDTAPKALQIHSKVYLCLHYNGSCSDAMAL